ncbi:hypothetical protein Tco_0242827 [Tanacetum coccineum]
MDHAAIEEMINQRVNAALEAHQVNQNLALGNNNGNNNGNGNGNDNGNGNGNNNGNGNGNDNGDGNENGNGNGNNGGDNGVVRHMRTPNVNGCGGVLVARGIITGCHEVIIQRVLKELALTWWNSHKRTIRTDAAFALSWRDLHLRFQELIHDVHKMVPEEERWVAEYSLGGLPDNIQGNNEEKKYEEFAQGYTIPLPPTQTRPNSDIRGLCLLLSVEHKGNITGKIAQDQEPKTVETKASVPDARGQENALGGGDVNPGSNTVTGDKGDKEKKSKLSIISCEKAQKYMEKGCQLFLAQVTVKENKDKSDLEKRLKGSLGLYGTFQKFFSRDLHGNTTHTTREETAFQTLKQKLCSAPIFALPEGSEKLPKNHEKNYTTHDLDFGSCGVRSQDIDGHSLRNEVEARKEENYGTEDLHGILKKWCRGHGVLVNDHLSDRVGRFSTILQHFFSIPSISATLTIMSHQDLKVSVLFSSLPVSQFFGTRKVYVHGQPDNHFNSLFLKTWALGQFFGT